MSKKRNKLAVESEGSDFDDTVSDESWEATVTNWNIGRQNPTAVCNEERRRDWRDVEKYREARELRRELEDTAWLNEIEFGDNTKPGLR